MQRTKRAAAKAGQKRTLELIEVIINNKRSSVQMADSNARSGR